jgi:cell division FtsZ-interacting protein ZapD
MRSQCQPVAEPPAEKLRDEVYRQMFRLEAGRPGAGTALALALLRAWMAWEQLPRRSEARQWLRQLCPLCLQMIESQGRRISTER